MIGAAFFIILDRFFKSLAINGASFNLISDIFRFNFAGNYNIAFSLPFGGQILIWLIILITTGLLCAFVYLYKKQEYIFSSFIFLIILGSASNLLDRLKYGFVVDYLDFKYFTIFNIADALIVFGVFLLVFYYKKSNR